MKALRASQSLVSRHEEKSQSKEDQIYEQQDTSVNVSNCVPKASRKRSWKQYSTAIQVKQKGDNKNESLSIT